MCDMGMMALSSVPMMFPIANLHGSLEGEGGEGEIKFGSLKFVHPQEVVTFQQALCHPMGATHS